MILTPEPIITNPTNMIRWVRVAIETEDGIRAYLLLAASRNFIMDHYRIPNGQQITQDNETRWLEMAIEEFRQETLNIEEGRVYYHVYAHTPEGQRSLIHFLSEIVP